jgi:hypothetical protein
MSEEMKMAMIDGVPTRSFWIEEDDSRLSAGVLIARTVADDDGDTVRAADIDPMSEDTLRIHAWGERSGYLIFATAPDDPSDAMEVQVYRFPIDPLLLELRT